MGCLLIGIIVDGVYEDVEDFDTSLTPGDNVNVMVGPQDTTVVLIDDLGMPLNFITINSVYKRGKHLLTHAMLQHRAFRVLNRYCHTLNLL